MTHDLYRELLQRELDDDLTADEQGMLDAHLSTCADCRLERDEYRSLSFGLSKLSRVMPERSFVPQMELEIKRAVQEQRRTRTPRVPTWWRSAAAAAAVVLAVGLGYWQFAGPSGGTDGHLAFDSGAQSKMGAPDAKGQPQAGASTEDISISQPEQPDAATTTEQSQDQTAMILTPKSAPASSQEFDPTGVPQEHVGPAAGSMQAKLPETNPAAATSPVDDNDPLGGLIGGTFGSSSTDIDATENPSAPPEDTMGISGGRTGILGGAEHEPTPMIGETPRLATITEHLQQAVLAGDITAQWATDPARVVEHSRKQLGFRDDATVRATDRADRVRIEQDGMKYEVRLEQPYGDGANGIWRPALLGRVIDSNAPDSLQRPIVDYFRTNASNTWQGDLLALSEFDEHARTLRIAADLENVTHEYLCTLHLNAQGDWELAGAPVAQ